MVAKGILVMVLLLLHCDEGLEWKKAVYRYDFFIIINIHNRYIGI